MAPTVLLGAIAATTTRIRLQTGVTVLSLLDPVRVAEDYATIDQLSRGRLEPTIGTEIIPTVRREAPTTLWEEADPYAGRPAFARPAFARPTSERPALIEV